MKSTRLLLSILLLVLSGCAGMDSQSPQSLPRGFPQPGSPFPYNSTGW